MRRRVGQRDRVAVQPRLRARELGPLIRTRTSGRRTPSSAVVRHRQRRTKSARNQRRHGDGKRRAEHLERRTDPSGRAGDAAPSARAEAPTSRAGRRARATCASEGEGNVFAVFGGGTAERRPPLVVQTNSRSSSRARRGSSARRGLTSAVIKLRAGAAPTSSLRVPPLGCVMCDAAANVRASAEPLSPSLMLRSAARAGACRGVGGGGSRSRRALPRAPSPLLDANPRAFYPNEGRIRAAASSRAARRGVLSLESCDSSVTSAAASTDTAAATSPAALKDADGKDISGAGNRRRFVASDESRWHARLHYSAGYGVPARTPRSCSRSRGCLQIKPVFMGQEERKVPRRRRRKCVLTPPSSALGSHLPTKILRVWPSRARRSSGRASRRPALDAVRVGHVFREDDEAYAIWRDVVGVPSSVGAGS